MAGNIALENLERARSVETPRRADGGSERRHADRQQGVKRRKLPDSKRSFKVRDTETAPCALIDKVLRDMQTDELIASKSVGASPRTRDLIKRMRSPTDTWYKARCRIDLLPKNHREEAWARFASLSKDAILSLQGELFQDKAKAEREVIHEMTADIAPEIEVPDHSCRDNQIRAMNVWRGDGAHWRDKGSVCLTPPVTQKWSSKNGWLDRVDRYA